MGRFSVQSAFKAVGLGEQIRQSGGLGLSLRDSSISRLLRGQVSHRGDRDGPPRRQEENSSKVTSQSGAT